MMTTLEHALQRWFGWPPPPPAGIDFGNGARLGAEDVLETHFQRLARTRPPAASVPVQVPVQVGDNLFTAITVLAPQLAPLATLAEDVASALPPVQPTPTFRNNLHHALEQTHRQHAAQRVLGTRLETAHPASHNRQLWIRIAIAGLSALCVVAVGIWLFSPKRRSIVSS